MAKSSRPRVVGNTPTGQAPPQDEPAPATNGNGRHAPPHNLEAEEALLGAMLLNADAAEVGIARLDAGMLYKPAHRFVFEAIEELYLERTPIDPLVVADRLDLNGHLAAIGGPGALAELEAKTPSTSNALHYAELVERDARRRQVIAAAYSMAEDAYGGTDWHANMGRLIDVGQRNGVVHSLSSLDDVDLAPILAGDVSDEPPAWLERTDGAALLYPGKVHDFHSEPSVGKTWLACHAIAEVLTAGGSAMYLDYEDRPQTIAGRLLALGATRELIGARDRFRYLDPAGAIGDAERAHLAKVLGELTPDLVILDGVATSIARCGLDENSNSDVTRWADAVVNPLAAQGAAVVLLDHVPKPSSDTSKSRARGGRGAGAKLALITGASFEVKIGRAYSRTSAGSMRVVIAKDRIGFVGGIGEVAAEVTVRPTEDGKRVELEVAPRSSDRPRLTGIMERLSKIAEDQRGPATAERLFAGANSKRVFLDQALADLVDDGYLERLDSSGTLTYRALRRFREDPGDPRHGEALLEATVAQGTLEKF